MQTLLTDRQKELLQLIYEYIKDTGYPPTFEDMRDGLGVVSNQAVLDLLKKIEAGDFIRRDSSTARSMVILQRGYEALGLTHSMPMAYLGVTSAGKPMEAVEISGEWEMKPTSDVARASDEVFLLKVMGDSMIGAGIEDEDLLLVQKREEFISGDIVLAQTRDESTVKRFMSTDQPPYLYLKPENPKYTIIPFTDDMELKGKVISVLKNGSWKALQ